MARNYKELQAKMHPADVAENKQRVREERQRMALDELRNAKQLTQADMAELLDVPQSSISRIEQRADMYLSTLRNYVQAMGGVLQIQAVFPEGGTVISAASETMKINLTSFRCEPQPAGPINSEHGLFIMEARCCALALLSSQAS